MSYLETKRNAIMNAIASGQLHNYIDDLTFEKGYLSYDGSIHITSPAKEVYSTNTIPSGIYIVVSDNTSWFVYADYDDNDTFVQRSNTLLFRSDVSVINSSYKFKISLSTQGIANVGIYNINDLPTTEINFDEI